MASAGIFYSMMVIALLAPVVLYILSYMDAVKTQGEQIVVKFEGIELANFADSVANDFPRVLDIASKRAVIAIIDYDDNNQKGVDDARWRLKELILNNTIKGVDSSVMLNSSFGHWINSTVDIGMNHGFYASISVAELTVNQTGPFTLNFTSRLEVNMTDNRSMELRRNYTHSLLVSIEGFDDPLYLLSSRGLVTKSVRAFNRTINDTESVTSVMINGYYVPSKDGPCFLERLENKTYHIEDSCPGAGIESLVDLDVFPSDKRSEYRLYKENHSSVDYMFFNGTITQWQLETSGLSGCNVTGITDSYPWFRLDNNTHAADYGVNESLVCPFVWP
ncbi:MAG: hypothetical protein NT157_00565 [Candidatus Micrarchaeota archaeon]|nr:hypothetical protein [Candidatus Micrarchaeota archaeon]